MSYQPRSVRLFSFTKPYAHIKPEYAQLLGDYRTVHEALKRHFVEKGEAEIIAERAWPDGFPLGRARELYTEHAGKDFFDQLMGAVSGERLVGKDIITFIARSLEQFKSEEAARKYIQHLRDDVLGFKDPSKAKPGSFRRDFVYRRTGENMARANQENRSLINCSHLSEKEEEGGIFYRDAMWKPDEKRLVVVNFDALPEKIRNFWVIGTGAGEGIFLDERIHSYYTPKRLKEMGIDPSSPAGRALSNGLILSGFPLSPSDM